MMLDHFRRSNRIAGPAGTVVIAEDNEDLRTLLVELARQAGFTTYEATNGREAIGMIRTAHPKVVVLDFIMPDIDGRAVVEEMRRDPTLLRVPVIMVTGYSGIQFRKEDNVRILLKPFDVSLFVSTLSQAVV